MQWVGRKNLPLTLFKERRVMLSGGVPLFLLLQQKFEKSFRILIFATRSDGKQ